MGPCGRKMRCQSFASLGGLSSEGGFLLFSLCMKASKEKQFRTLLSWLCSVVGNPNRTGFNNWGGKRLRLNEKRRAAGRIHESS